MRQSRRDACKLVGSAAALALLDRPVLAKTKPSRVLILGGTGFIGPHFVHALAARGHALTLFNRGRSKQEARPGVEQLTGDRDGQLDALKGRDWDVVIDNSGYTPHQVKLTADLLHGHVQQYIYISSIAAYADFDVPNIDESYRRAKLEGPTDQPLTGKTYGPFKAVCEQLLEQAYGTRATLIRPTYIVGPGDTSDRFTYWPMRVARGGEMLAPGTPTDPIQFVDARDLADFMCIVVEQRLSGRYNICSTPRSVTMGMLLDTSKRITNANTTFAWASEAFMDAQKLIDRELLASDEIPIWMRPSGHTAAAPLVSNARAVSKGLRFRPLEQIIRDTLEWQKQRPPAEQTLSAGLKPEREAEVLKALHAS
jgi:2'-hydroxyisoflavone reductase